ncbi:DUF982 domain-containing protein [Sesbania bispinosa]|nr:DUF982 domain-containing protein [Sesbania bispinosa]
MQCLKLVRGSTGKLMTKDWMGDDGRVKLHRRRLFVVAMVGTMAQQWVRDAYMKSHGTTLLSFDGTFLYINVILGSPY